jgi:hypothetical protein
MFVPQSVLALQFALWMRLDAQEVVALLMASADQPSSVWLALA